MIVRLKNENLNSAQHIVTAITLRDLTTEKMSFAQGATRERKRVVTGVMLIKGFIILIAEFTISLVI